MKSRQLNDAIVFILRETGWTLDYIFSLHPNKLSALFSELHYQKSIEDYALAQNAAMITANICTSLSGLSGRPKKYQAKDFIGNPPEKKKGGIMARNLTKSSTPVKVLINDREYTLAPFTLKIMLAMEEKYDKPFLEIMQSGRVTPIVHLVYLLIQEATPDFNEDTLRNLSVKQLEPIVKAVTKAIGS